jgi:hypothetical protein
LKNTKLLPGKQKLGISPKRRHFSLPNASFWPQNSPSSVEILPVGRARKNLRPFLQENTPTPTTNGANNPANPTKTNSISNRVNNHPPTAFPVKNPNDHSVFATPNAVPNPVPAGRRASHAPEKCDVTTVLANPIPIDASANIPNVGPTPCIHNPANPTINTTSPTHNGFCHPTASAQLPTTIWLTSVTKFHPTNVNPISAGLKPNRRASSKGVNNNIEA